MGISPYPPYFILTAVLIWSTYLLGLVIYRLFFHPLAKFPGPKYAALSRWHEFYYEVVKKGQFTFVIQEYHKKYGERAPLNRIDQRVYRRKESVFDIGVDRAHRSYSPGRDPYPGPSVLRHSLHKSRPRG